LRVCLICGTSIENRRTTAKYCPTCAKIKTRSETFNKQTDKQYRQTWGDKQYHIVKRAAHSEQGVNCIVCGWTIKGMHYGGCNIHHIIPLSEGGKDHKDNVAVLCPNCHVLAHQDLITKDELLGLAEIARRTRPDLEQIRDLVNKKLRPLNTKIKAV